MKYTSDHNTEIFFSSPQEVLLFRANRNSGKRFSDYEPLTPDITNRLKMVYIVHGYLHEENCLGVLLRAGHALLYSYDFRQGYILQFGPSVFPDFIQKDKVLCQKAIEYAIMVIEAFGWTVSFHEDKSWYYLSFLPLQALTPEETSREVEKRVNIITAEAMKVINTGLISHQRTFTRDELKLGNVFEEDLRLCIQKIRNHYDSWNIQISGRKSAPNALILTFSTPS